MKTSSFPNQRTLNPKVKPWHVPEQFPLIFIISLFKTGHESPLSYCPTLFLYLYTLLARRKSLLILGPLFLYVINRYALLLTPILTAPNLGATVTHNNEGKHTGNWTMGQFHWKKDTNSWPSFSQVMRPAVRFTWKPLLCSVAQWVVQS